MAGETIITVVGNLTSDPELRYTPAGAAVANFTIASTPRTYNRQTGQWEDGEALFLRASIWRDYAENVAETLKKGTRVIAQGRLKSRSYETKEGERRTSMEIELDEIGPALRYATAQVTRSQRTSGGNFGGQQGGNFGGNNFGNNPSRVVLTIPRRSRASLSSRAETVTPVMPDSVGSPTGARTTGTAAGTCS
ncbi:Helix-destabilizing protein [Rothia dentocariosa]|uniref:Single-stranded DNA-binding protein n=1 Tax=Rothia dentocariosa TaxID=2047 RepID=A0A448UXZ5_9MICC|nr:Helix-destabilizing protein [Rothia dentocariosa]